MIEAKEDNGIEKIAKEIAGEIIKYNNKSPDAVFLIGGSSQMVMLREKIAEYLGLPKERVSIRDTSSITNIEGMEELTRPDMITPLGIAMESVDKKYKNFLKVYFKNKEVMTFNTENVKVSDLLVLLDYDPRNLMPKISSDFIYYLNGKKRKIKGEIGSQPEIIVNKISSNLKTKLKDGDIIEISESKVKELQKPSLYNLVDIEENIFLNQNTFNLVKSVKVNNEIIEKDIILTQNDSIVVERISTIEELLETQRIDMENKKYFVNGLRVDKNYIFKKGDYLEILSYEDKKNLNTYQDKDKLNIDREDKKIENTNKETINIKDIREDTREDLTKNPQQSKLENTIVNYDKVIKLNINDKEMELKYKKDKFIFVDIFDYIDFDLSTLRGKLVLKTNNKDSEYLEELKDGDIIKIYWE